MSGETVSLDASPQYTAEYAADVLTVRMKVQEGWEQWFLLMADEHWDNPHCDRVMHRRHHEQAKARNAGIMKFGDFFCCMQGKYDPRASKESIRPEHQAVNYLDALVDTAGDYLAPYADNILLLAPGNHETAILKRLETNLTQRLASRLDITAGGYSGFVRFMFSQTNGGRLSHSLFWHHGSGGGGPVTKGVIGTNRRAVWLPDPTFVVSGHIHEEWLLTMPRLRLGSTGKTFLDEQVHLCLPTYKQEFTLAGGYHIENGRPPKPLGAAWLRFFWDTHRRGNVGYELTRAK
jgi:hypothetical protein